MTMNDVIDDLQSVKNTLKAKGPAFFLLAYAYYAIVGDT